jgi:hypothetical protein
MTDDKQTNIVSLGDLHQGPRGTDQRLYDKRRLSADERLAIHRIRQFGTGEVIDPTPQFADENDPIISAPLVFADYIPESDDEIDEG